MSNTDCVEIDDPSRSVLSRAVILHHSASSTDDNIPFNPATLTVSHLHYEVTIKERRNSGWKRFFKKHNRVQKALIANVSLIATPGRVLAIMGPSGSGKS
jgi:ABC-type glutathione transport system ATPase component